MKDKTKERIQELCPDVMATHECNCPSAEDIVGFPITLAVALRAIRKIDHKSGYAEFAVDEFGRIRTRDSGGGLSWVRDAKENLVEWNLEKDNWDSQSAETQAFVGNLLGVN